MKSKNKFLSSVVMLLAFTIRFYVLRPLKAVGAGLGAFSRVMGIPGGVLTNGWLANQNIDGPASSANASVAAAGTVACNGEVGRITLTGFTAAAGAMQIATITNTKVVSTTVNGTPVISYVLVTLDTYAGTYATNGVPEVIAAVTTAGQFIIRILNSHATNALSGNITVIYTVHQPVL